MATRSLVAVFIDALVLRATSQRKRYTVVINGANVRVQRLPKAVRWNEWATCGQ
jgi:hypothetical protein